MDSNINSCTGTLKVSEEVITEITLNAINETNGVARYNASKIFKFAGQPPVSVKVSDGTAEITVLIGVEFGQKATACAEEVQKNIKSNVQNMTGIMVSKVNVKIISLF